MKIALASPSLPQSIEDSLLQAEKLIKEAAGQQAAIICFPESYIPGYPIHNEPQDHTAEELQAAFTKVCAYAAEHSIAVVLPMNWYAGENFYNVVHVISAEGKSLGYQTKNQLDPSEDARWIAGTERSVFEVNGVKFGITICHEGFRYPESVRWTAQHDAKIVFHPHCAGSDSDGKLLAEFGSKDNPYYEKAMMMRALENTIYFASCNYSFRYPESASAVIAPDGTCIAHEAYGNPGVIVVEIDPELATGFLAKRFKNHLYVAG
jgi:predicted amidohydrolase